MKLLIWHSDLSFRWLVALLVLMGAADILEARIIDDFSVGPYALVGADATVNQTQVGLDPNHVLGGSRFISFRSFALPPSSLTVADAAGTVNVSPGGCCTYLTLRYGGANNPQPFNLREDGSDRLVVSFAALTSEIVFSLPSIFVSDVQGHGANILGQQSIQPVSPFSIAVPYSQFSNIGWTKIQSIEVGVSRYGGGTGGAGKSFSLDSLVTVPEPASILAVWIALGLLVVALPGRIRGIASVG